MPQKHTWTEEQKRDVSARFAAGEGALGIAKSYGFATGKAVVDLLKDLGEFEPNRRFQGQFTLAQKAEMAERYLAGESYMALGRAFGCHPGNVRSIIQHRGVQSRPLGLEDDPGLDDAIREMRKADESVSCSTMAKRLGVTRHRVMQRARALGFEGPLVRRGPKSNLWTGGRLQHKSSGYVYVWVHPEHPLRSMATFSGHVAEHRLVMAQSLGRLLTSAESVHHINGVKTDNRLENLQLRKGNHGKGVVMACLDCGSHNVGAVPIG